MLQNTDKFSGKSGAETFANMVRDLEDQLNIEHHFSEIVEKQTYTDMINTIKQTAVEDPCSLVNPRKVAQSDVENILNNLM